VNGELTGRLGLGRPATYQIRFQGRLDDTWSHYFGGMTVSTEPATGEPVSTLSGLVADQAALLGILNRLYDLGLPLLFVKCLSIDGGSAGRQQAKPASEEGKLTSDTDPVAQ
jgi:hypothetical protein